MEPILRSLRPEDFLRKGNHSEAGPITLEKLLTNITNHIPHHVKFIETVPVLHSGALKRSELETLIGMEVHDKAQEARLEVHLITDTRHLLGRMHRESPSRTVEDGPRHCVSIAQRLWHLNTEG